MCQTDRIKRFLLFFSVFCVLSFVVCQPFIGCLFVLRYRSSFFVVCCMFSVVCCLLFVVCYLLFAFFLLDFFLFGALMSGRMFRALFCVFSWYIDVELIDTLNVK